MENNMLTYSCTHLFSYGFKTPSNSVRTILTTGLVPKKAKLSPHREASLLAFLDILSVLILGKTPLQWGKSFLWNPTKQHKNALP